MGSNECNQEQLNQIKTQSLEAVAANDLDKFKSLIESSIDEDGETSSDDRDDILYSSLILAAEKGHTGIVEFLLKKDVTQANERNADGFTALDLAAQNGHLEVVQALLEHKNIEVWDVNRKSNPLLSAASNGHQLVVEALIMNRRSRAIHYRYENIEFMDSDDEHQTALFIDSPNVNYSTPLHLAAHSGHEAIVDSLLMFAAEITIDIEENTPLHLAAREGHTEVVRSLLYSEMDGPGGPRFFEDEDIKIPCVNLKNEDKMTPLHLASERGHDEVVEILLDHDEITVNATCFGGSTALHLATKGGHLKSIKHLLEHPKISNPKDVCGKTALKIAREKGFSLCVQALARRFKR